MREHAEIYAEKLEELKKVLLENNPFLNDNTKSYTILLSNTNLDNTIIYDAIKEAENAKEELKKTYKDTSELYFQYSEGDFTSYYDEDDELVHLEEYYGYLSYIENILEKPFMEKVSFVEIGTLDGIEIITLDNLINSLIHPIVNLTYDYTDLELACAKIEERYTEDGDDTSDFDEDGDEIEETWEIVF